MPVPITTQLFDAFLGTQEGVHSIILPDILSSGGSANLYIDKFARTRSMSGYTRQTAAPVTTNTGASSARFRNLFPWRGTSGGSVSRRVLGVLDDGVDEWEWHVSADDGVTWTFLFDAGAGAVGKIGDFAQFGDIGYLTNGVTAPRAFNGTTLSAAGGTQSPTPTATESATAGELLGTYRYKLLSIASDGTRNLGSAASAALSVQTKQVTLAWAADADTDVQGYEVYRTTGTGAVYYFLTYIDGRTTVAYTDNVNNLTLLENRVMAEHGDPPPTVYFCEPHKSRMWWLRTDEFPTRGWYSDPGDADSVNPDNYLTFEDSETVGDILTGGLGNYEGLFVVFTELAVWTVSGTGAVIGDYVDWTRVRTNARTGCVHHQAATRVSAGAKYVDEEGKTQKTGAATVAYFTPLGDIRLWDGDNDLVISTPVSTTLSTFNYAQRSKTHCLDMPEYHHVVWFFAAASADEPSIGVAWNYRWGVWYPWTSTPFSASCELDNSTDASFTLTAEADRDGKGALVYAFFTGSTFDGDAITSIWMTKTLRGVNQAGQPELFRTKRWRFVDLLFAISQNIDLTVAWLPGNAPDDGSALGSVAVTPDGAYLFSSSGDRLVSATGDALVCSEASTQVVVPLQETSGAGTGRYYHDTGIRLRVSSSSILGQWSLEAMVTGYQILEGLKRRRA